MKYRKINVNIAVRRTARLSPINPNNSPNTAIKINVLAILRIDIYPILVDSFASNLGIRIAVKDLGIIASNNICNAGIPSTYLGKNDGIKIGAKNIAIIAITIDEIMTM